MELRKLFKPFLLLNIILFLSFCLCINNFTKIPNIHNFFYVFFHLTYIYFLFYHYHYSIYFIAFIYGVFLDIILINNLGVHLLPLVFLILIYTFIKKFLLQLSSYQISAIIYLFLFTLLLIELTFAHILYNLNFQIITFLKLIVVSLIIFIPSIFLFNKLDRL